MINWKRMLLNGVLRLLVRRRFKHRYSAAKVRGIVARIDRNYTPPEDINYRKEKLVELDCEWFEPLDIPQDAPLILYFPGGGFFLSAMTPQRQMLVDLARRNGCRAVLAQYRLAPEHPMPTGQRDGFKFYQHLIGELDYSPRQIFLLGDSAGGNVVLSTLMQARDGSYPLPAGAMLISPGSDLTMVCDSTLENLDKDPMFHISALLWMLKQGLPNTVASNDPLVSPSRGDFSGLPPLLFEVGSTEILRDHSTLAAENALRDGVETQITISHKSPHVYPVAGFLPEAKDARQRMSAFIERLRQPGEVPSVSVEKVA